MQGEDQAFRGLTGSLGERLVTGALCLMVVAVPLAMMTGIFEYSVLPKRLTLHVCLALACLGWIIQIRWGQHIHLVSRRRLLPAVCFMGVALISSHNSIHSLDTQTELVNLAALVILFLIGANAVSFERFGPILWTNAITGLLVAMIGILQYHGFAFLDIPSNAQPSATFGNRNFAAEYLVCAGPLSILLFFQGRRRTGLFFSGLSAALMGVYLSYTRTRGAWLGIAIAIALVGAAVISFPELRRTILGSIRSRMDRRKRMMGGAFVVVFIFLSVLPARRSITDLQGKALPFLTESRSDLAATATSFFKKDVGVEYRLAAWKGTLRMVADFPFIGVGPGNWVRVFPAYDRAATTHPGTFMNSPHNDYLLIASEYGLIGLFVFIWLIAAGIRGLVEMGRSPDLEARIAAPMFAISLVSFLGVAVFAFPKEHPQTVMFFYLLLGVVAGADRGGRVSPGPGWGLILAIFLLSIALVASEISRRRIEFERHYFRALSWAGEGRDWETVLSELENSSGYGTFHSDVLASKGEVLKNLQRPSEAVEAYRQALSHTPNAWYVHAGLSSVYIQLGRFRDALTHCQEALSLCPSATEVRKRLGVIYYHLNDIKKAEEVFRSILQSESKNAGVHLNLGNLFAARGMPDSAIVYYLQALRIDPKESKAHFALGNVSYNLGLYPEAVNAYRRFLNLSRVDTAFIEFVKKRVAHIERVERKKGYD